MVAATPAGNLRHRVRFDRKTSTQVDGGGALTDWSTLGTGSFVRWADIRPQRGGAGETVMEKRLQGVQPALIIVRADSSTRGVDPSWRAVHVVDGVDVQAFALKTAQDMEMDNQFVTLLAVAGDPDS